MLVQHLRVPPNICSSTVAGGTDPEPRRFSSQRIRLDAQASSSGRSFLDHRGILLSGLIHTIDRCTYLRDGSRLRRIVAGHLAKQRVNLSNSIGNAVESAIDFLHRLHGSYDFGLSEGKLIAGALRFFLGAHGERTDKVGNDRETSTGIACAPCFNRSIHSQYPRLECDLVDALDDLVDPLCAFFYPAHGLDRFPGDCTTAGKIAHCLVGARYGAGCSLCGSLDPRIDLHQRGRGFLQACGIAFGSPRKILRGMSDLTRACADSDTAFGYRTDQVTQ